MRLKKLWHLIHSTKGLDLYAILWPVRYAIAEICSESEKCFLFFFRSSIVLQPVPCGSRREKNICGTVGIPFNRCHQLKYNSSSSSYMLGFVFRSFGSCHNLIEINEFSCTSHSPLRPSLRNLFYFFFSAMAECNYLK